MKIDLTKKNKNEIIDSFAEFLGFPLYYSRNWDSFEEVICDAIEEGSFPMRLEIIVDELNHDVITCLKILADQGLIVSGELTFVNHSTSESL